MAPSFAEFACQMLEDHPKARAEAAIAIAELGLTGGPEEPIIIPRIGKGLDETDWRVRKAAADSLGDLSTPEFWGREPSSTAKLAIPELVKRFADGDIHARRALKEPLKRIVKSGHLGDMSDINRIAAPAIHNLIKRLRDEDWRVRENAAKAIGDLETSAIPAVSDLVECLADDGMRVRAAAKKALDKLYNSRAIVDISMIGGDAVPKLVEKLHHSDWRVVSAAAWALGQVGGCYAIGGLQLKKDLADANWAVRLLAVEALGEVGCCALAAIPDIALRLTDEQDKVKKAAKNALVKMSALLHSRCPLPAPIVQRLVRATYAQPAQPMQSPQAMTAQTQQRIAALTDLGELGHIALPAVPDIMRALADDKREICLAAQNALGRLGEQGVFGVLGFVPPMEISALAIELASKPPPEVFPELLNCLDDDHWAIRLAAAEALSALAIRASYVIPKLRQHTQDGEMRLNVAAKRMLEALGECGAMLDIDTILPDVVSELSDRMGDDEGLAMSVDSQGNQDEYKIGMLATLNVCEMATSAMSRLFQAGLLRSPDTGSTDRQEETYGTMDDNELPTFEAPQESLEELEAYGSSLYYSYGTSGSQSVYVQSTPVTKSLQFADVTFCCESCKHVVRVAHKFCGKCGSQRPDTGWSQA